MQQNFTSKSGAKVILNIATFKEATTLKKTILSEAKEAGIEVSDIQTPSKKKGAGVDSMKVLSLLKDLIVNIETSDGFESAVFSCLRHCTYDGKQINESFFDDCPEAREDYYEVMIACAKFNLLPFVKNLPSVLSSLVSLNVSNQK